MVSCIHGVSAAWAERDLDGGRRKNGQKLFRRVYGDLPASFIVSP